MPMSKLAQRVVTAVVLIAGLLMVFFVLPDVAGVAVLALFMLMGAWEWGGFLSLRVPAGRLTYVGCIAALLIAGIMQIDNPGRVQWIIWSGLGWWLVAFIWLLRYPTPIRPAVGAVCGALVLVPACIAMVSLFRFGRGPGLALLLLAIVWAADIGAYFVGRRVGRVRLAPRVSPGKTWEGVLGGLCAAALVSVAGAVVLELPVGGMVPLGVAVAAISVVGDLTVSMFKRNAGLKDSGRMFPGHGGVLDRVDGVTAAAPLFALTLSRFGLVGV